MADQKLSGLPTDSSLTSTHSVPVTNPTGPTTKKTLLSTLAAWLFNQTNLPAGATGSPVTRAADNIANYVSSGLFWTADSVGSTRNASMTAGVVYINGRRISISAVTARSMTASLDTYIDVLDNLDGTGTLVYTTVANNAASPTLASNSLRIGIITTGASSIAATGNINQGGATGPTSPTISSSVLLVSDSLGNMICCRSSNPTLIAVRSGITNSAGVGSFANAIPCPAIIPRGRNVEALGYYNTGQFNTNQNDAITVYVVLDATTTVATGVSWINGSSAGANAIQPAADDFHSPTVGLHSYTLSGNMGNGAHAMAQGSGKVMIKLA